MDADFQKFVFWLLQGMVGIFCTLIAFGYKDMKSKQEATQKELTQYKLHVAEHYTTRDDLKEAVTSINKSFENFSDKLDIRLDRIESKLDRKQDKL